MAVKDSQIRQVMIEFLKRPDSNSKRSIGFHNVYNENEGILHLCREKIPGFNESDEAIALAIDYLPAWLARMSTEY